MQYSIYKNHHNDFSVIELNNAAPRAYFIPFSNEELLTKTDCRKERSESDKVRLLSGEWDFKFYKSINKLPDNLNTARLKFDKINLPCTWQRTGYQNPAYLNCPYEFDNRPPEIPDDMAVGVYRKFIEINDTDKVYTLTFLGISSCADVYVNGSFVGYTEGSHNTAEFDISPFIKLGQNEILVVNFKWCNGTFLEAQDMFRENGIFRDVLLYENSKTYIYDCALSSSRLDKGYSFTASLDIEGEVEGFCATVKIMEGDTVIASKTEAADNKMSLCFDCLDVLEWNPEIPKLYEIRVLLSSEAGVSEVTRFYYGFRTIEIKGRVFYFNGRNIKIRGVNHHDSHLTKGYAMSLDDIEYDIQLMKDYNVNGVRTSHYPPDPFFLTLADIYGLYVIDEADIETHGCGALFGDVCLISKNKKWAAHYVDRVKRMYQRDKNHPCVTMWSLGNESGGYACQDACYDYLKAHTNIPVHYEHVIHTKRFAYDVISEMYTSSESMEAMLTGKYKKKHSKQNGVDLYSQKPFFLCEYCHAMGVGPGNLEEYWQVIYSDDRFMGGCIWEWSDHTVYHDGSDSYKYKYTYGGDHKEKRHDGHFCVDGLFYADRRPHTGALEMKAVYRPIYAADVGEGYFCFTNKNDFRNASYITIRWELHKNGSPIESGSFELDLPAKESLEYLVPHSKIDSVSDYHINFTYFDGDKLLATEQILLQLMPNFDLPKNEGKLRLESDSEGVTILFDGGKAVFSALGGGLCSYKLGKKELINQDPEFGFGFLPNITRAFIDNDSGPLNEKWKKVGLDKCYVAECTDFSCNVYPSCAEITSTYLLPLSEEAYIVVDITHFVMSDGRIVVMPSLVYKTDDVPDDLPRFGMTIELSRELEFAEYYGRGTAENMPDFSIHAPVGIYKQAIDDMQEHYVYPQENGMHCDARWLKLTDKKGKGLKISGNLFNFSIHHYTQHCLNLAKHIEDVFDMDTSFLTLDSITRGIGSSSCGPDTRAEYRIDVSDLPPQGFVLEPIK